MDSLIEVFHLDIKLFIAQVVNFAIVFGVLYHFAIKPIMAVMKERTAKIEKSLADAAAIENKLKEAEERQAAIITEAKKEASVILEKANVMAEKKKEEMITKAKNEIGAIINQEKVQMQTEKQTVLNEIRREVADLVVVSLEKVLGEKMDLEKDKEVIKKMIKH